MSTEIEIHSKGFTFLTPVKEGEPNQIKWTERGKDRTVTFLVKSSMGIFQRFRMDDKLWHQIGKGDKSIFLKKTEWESLSADDRKKLEDFFTTTFQEAVGIAKKVRVEMPEFGSEVVEKEAKRVTNLVKNKLVEMIAAAKSSVKRTSKLFISKTVGVIRCETQQPGDVKISAERGAGKGSFKTTKKMIDFGSAEKIVVGNKVYAYLKLHNLKHLPPEEAQARIQTLREEIETMHFFAAHGAQNIAKLYQVKTRKFGDMEGEVPIGIMMEWCDLGDAGWIGRTPPEKGTKEYFDTVRIARDAAVGLASLHSSDIGHILGDIKPENILITTTHGQVAARIGDFGAAVPIGSKVKSLSLAYAAPEILIGKKKHIATPQSDAWSFGVSLLEMFHGNDSNEFAKMASEKEWVGALAKIKSTLDSSDPIDALIVDCFNRPELRPTLQQAADRLQTLIQAETPPKKPLSTKETARREAQEIQRLLDWKLRATTPTVASIVEVIPEKKTV